MQFAFTTLSQQRPELCGRMNLDATKRVWYMPSIGQQLGHLVNAHDAARSALTCWEHRMTCREAAQFNNVTGTKSLERTTGSDERLFRMRGRLGAARGRSVPALGKRHEK
jgi:hypothetical protein